ncbi:hypothetical protein [Chelativorans sp. M5D2P16]|uniref:hypothetical protein n=1 Tax=Chelativorans sp. M5D2P16 TaxID=3095678 RepID=UPI002ACA08EA|nr:hypothetical protein [Chelativorans sp. M5D2P16]MDZ5696685.1 hypothetical protein [Chelativorans sp. M5D2P16]
MSYDEHDAMREEFYDRMVKEVLSDHKVDIIGDFTLERLRSYYEQNPDLEIRAEVVLDEAEKLLQVSPSASLVFSFVSLEITIRDVLLKPIAYGLVHDKNFSDVVAELVVGNRHIKKLLFQILDDVGHVGLTALRRSKEAKKDIWAEKEELRQRRDEIVHRGAEASAEEAEVALALATFFLRRLYPSLRDRICGWDERFVSGSAVGTTITPPRPPPQPDDSR